MSIDSNVIQAVCQALLPKYDVCVYSKTDFPWWFKDFFDAGISGGKGATEETLLLELEREDFRARRQL